MVPPPQARKFGAPLFFCTFTESSDEVVLGGGGGSSSTGVANRLLLVKTEAEAEGKGKGKGEHQCRLECDPAGELHTGAVTCVNGAWVKSKQYFISVMSGGDLLVKYKLDRGSKGSKKEEELQFRKIDIDRSKTKSIEGAEVKSIASNFTGAHVAVGLDNGKIVVFESDKMEQTRFFDPNKHSQVPPKGGVMNLSYSACGTRIVAVKDSGLAFIWDMSAAGKKKTNKASPVTPIESPTPGGMFRGCYSYSLSKDTSKISFCLGVNVKGKSFLTTWSMDKHSKGKGNSKVLLTRKVAAHQSALTALAGYSTPVRKGATSTEGEKHLVATACSEGEIAVYSLEHGLTCLVRVPNAHMIFVTNLAFSNDGKRVVSVSADAGARITSIVRSGDQVARARQLRYALLFLLLAMIIYYFLLNNHS